MRVKSKYVVVTGIQIPSFDEMNWKILLKVPPNGPASDPIRPSTSLLWGTPIKVKPRQVRDVKEPVILYDQDHEDSNTHLREQKKGQDPLQHGRRLQPPGQRDVEGCELHLHGPAGTDPDLSSLLRATLC